MGEKINQAVSLQYLFPHRQHGRCGQQGQEDSRRRRHPILGQRAWRDFWNRESARGEFRNSLGTEMAVEAPMEKEEALKRKGLGGGRARTRTVDLLRVKLSVHPTLLILLAA